MEFRNNELFRQFEARQGENLIVMEYDIQERKLFMTKLSTNGCEDEIFVNDFIKTVLNKAEEQRLRVVPINSKITTFFKKNPMYREMLAAGIRV